MIKLGSKLNPFDNVDSAFEHIIALEQDRLGADMGLQLYKKAPFVFDMNGCPVPSWCQPDTAFQAKDCPADAFIVTKQASGKFQFKPNLANRKYLYRGQVEHYPTCVPGLFRDPNQTYFLSDMILTHEMWRLIDSHPLVQLLGQQGVNLNGYPFKMFVNYGGISQHYFCRTRFLDLTSSVEAAKFFATCDYHKDSDSYTPHIENDIGVIYFFELVMPLAFQKIPQGNIEPYYHLSTIGKQIFPRSGAQHGYLFDMSKGIDFEKIGYTNAVYFRHDPIVSKRIFDESKSGLKYMPPSILDRYWREKMSSSKTDRMVSEAAVETNLRYNPHETKSSIIRKLKQRGFSISKGKPCFAPDQLAEYFQDIKNGWWEDEFCKDIYFWGKDGVAIQEAFRSLPTVSAYRFAFYR